MTDELMRPADVAAEFGIKVGTLKSWRSSTRRGVPAGPPSFTLTPGVVVYERLAVEGWIEERKAASRASQERAAS